MKSVTQEASIKNNNTVSTTVEESRRKMKESWSKVQEARKEMKENIESLKGQWEESMKKDPEKSISYDTPQDEPIEKGDYFVRGWWSTDKDGKEEVQAIITGETLYMQIDTQNIPDGAYISIRLFNERTLVVPKTGETNGEEYKIKITDTEKYIVEHLVKNNHNAGDYQKVTLNFDEKLIRKQEGQRLEIVFVCSYRDPETDIVYTQKLPTAVQDMLWIYPTMCIDRYKMPGLNPTGTDIADDMTYGKGGEVSLPIYTPEEIEEYKQNYEKTGFVEGRDDLFSNASSQYSVKTMYSEYETLNKTGYSSLMKLNSTDQDEFLFADFIAMAAGIFTIADSEMQTNTKQMIAKFRRNEGGIYENATLTDRISNSKYTLEYSDKVNKYIADIIKKGQADLILLEDNKVYFDDGYDGVDNTGRRGIGRNFTKPIFELGDLDNLLGGKTIALNDIWCAQVMLTKCLVWKNGNYTLTYKVTLLDHFGLDKPDLDTSVLKKKVPAAMAGFRAWYILQHLRGYKPFVTKMAFDKSYVGNKEIGKAEIEKMEAEKNAERERTKAMHLIMRPF